MKARSIKGKSPEEIQAALTANMNDGFSPTLAIVFCSVQQDRKAICKILSEHGIAVFGVTTNGEFISEETDKHSTAMLLLEAPVESFKVFFQEYPQKNYREVSRSIAKEALRFFDKPAFLLAGSHLETDAEQLLFGFEDAVGNNVSAFGAMAGDDYAFVEQFVFDAEHESSQGLVVIAFDEDKIALKGKAICGWHAVGTEKVVTKSEGNHVFTIDDVPALDITAKYSGIQNITPENQGLLMEVATTFPLQLQREKGEPVMRPGLLIDWNDHSFYCSGTVPQGSKVRFSLPPDFDVMEKVIKGAEELKEQEMPEADAVIVFSCAGRIVSLGPLMNSEIEGVKEVWNVPMVGMFSNAELGRATDGNLEMHNLTTCVVALKEK